ncbi:MAG: inositol monophosphatase family protein [Acidimicrobiia bacterium]
MDDLELARTAARTGAEIVARWTDRLEFAEFKGAVDPVTAADRESEEAIRRLIATHRPDDGVVGEEGDPHQGTSERNWLIDPLDGTVNFLHGFPQVSVSVAVADHEGGIAAVVHDVFRDEVFAAARGRGATLDDSPIRVAGRSELGRALVATGFAYDRQERGPEYGRILGEMLRHVRGIRRSGSAALDLAWVACGRLDGYWETGLGPWDVAAGFVLVTEAGGVVTAIDGGLATSASCVAANIALQPVLRRTVLAAVGG